MTIGIEAQRLFRTRKHGMDVAALELIHRLQQTDISNHYNLFAAKGPDTDCFRETPQFRLTLLPGFSYADWEQLSLPLAIARYNPDIVHCTANTAPLKCSATLVLTVHDIIYLEKTSGRGSLYQNAGNLYRKWVVPTAIRKAAAIITVSDYERRAIEERFPEAASKISVIYHGVNERFNTKYPTEELAAFRNQYALPADFILFLGNTAPKKNTDNTLKAYIHYRELAKSPLPLVVVDYPREAVQKKLSESGKAALMDSIICPGYVPVSQMPLLYRCSSLFLYPSLRESFGLPILEAMASGVPVITSTTSAMPEIAGAAAVLADPESPQQLAEAMQHLLNDETVRSLHIRKGIERASYFSWDNAAAQLLKVYSDHQH